MELDSLFRDLHALGRNVKPRRPYPGGHQHGEFLARKDGPTRLTEKCLSTHRAGWLVGRRSGTVE